MFGLVGKENPVVIDSLWNRYKTNEESESRTEFFKTQPPLLDFLNRH